MVTEIWEFMNFSVTVVFLGAGFWKEWRRRGWFLGVMAVMQNTGWFLGFGVNKKRERQRENMV